MAMMEGPPKQGPRGPRKVLKSNPSRIGVGTRRAGNFPHGGGGPENHGAQPTKRNNVGARQGQPPTSGEADGFAEYTGFAAPSIKPDLSGHRESQARQLAEIHGGRQ